MGPLTQPDLKKVIFGRLKHLLGETILGESPCTVLAVIFVSILLRVFCCAAAAFTTLPQMRLKM